MKRFINIIMVAVSVMLMAAANVFAYEVGDKITFGSYPFYEDGREKAIDWIILDIDEDNNALVISDYALDNVKYNDQYVNITWENSTIRKWLNETFLNKAFTDEQRSKIIESKIDNKDNVKYKTIGGKDTYDKLFLLSIEEVNNYFKSDKARIAYPTPYAKSKRSVNGNLYVSSNDVSTDRGGSCWWWLRSPGSIQGSAAGVRLVGVVHSYGLYVNLDESAVRVAFKINLNDLKSAPTNVGNSSTDVFVYEVGDKITFGSYPFYEDGREKAIDWIILDIDKNSNALVISDYALDNVRYNEYVVDITWENSSIRKWLNNDFPNKAFTDEQQSKIIVSYIENKDNAKYQTKGGNNTYDKLFLLSIDEANRYFKNDETRTAYPTPYAKSKRSVNGKLWVSSDYISTARGGSCWWWLRSPGNFQYRAARVNFDGSVFSYGYYSVNYDHNAVRPAFKINLNNLKSPPIDNGSSVAEFTKPPRLSVGNVSYSDSTNSNVLMADGEGNISFTVSNTAAGGTAYNLKAIVSAKDSNGNAVQGISFENTNEIGNIAPGKSVNVNIPIKTGENLAGGTAAFTITFSEANGFEPDSKTIKIQTVRTDPPDVQLAEFGLDDTEGELSFGNGNGIVEPGESIVLNLTLLNNGDGITKDTKITFESGDSEIHFIDNTQFSKGNIQPGGKVSLNTAFSISRRYKGSNTLPIKMKITDERNRFNKEIPLNIALKRSYPKTEIINIASNYKKPQKIKTQTDPLNNIPDAKTQNKYGVAVIIGVRNYENKVPPVLFAINDAQTVRDYVVKALGYNPDNIIYVENPTKGQMEEIFGTDKTHKGRLFNYIKPDRSDVLVYYAGHGAPDQGTKTAFFVPKDANPDYIKIGGYSMETFYANLAKLPAKNITVLTDACFSGQTGDGRMIIKHASPLAVSAKLPGTVNSKISVFNAGRDSEMASWYAEKQHGLFTYYFLLGLGGQADTNNDKTIIAGEIDAYLQENVPGIARRLYNREQHPVFTGNRNATIAEYK
ncbi:MAG: caspase family protein [Elusimicrobiales bacterium]|nr:caspase family protein [Elusimicrobiales bacterium]